METVEDLIRQKFIGVIRESNIQAVGEALREITSTEGLGIAILVAWQHGLEIGHIPLDKDSTTGEPLPLQFEKIDGESECPYVFVRVPVRQIRRDQQELIKRGIMNKTADPMLFIYHEDSLISTLTFKTKKSHIRVFLDALAQQGVIVQANIDNRQIQFKDRASKKLIEESGEPVYVKIDRPINLQTIAIPSECDLTFEDFLVRTKFKSACNYCSVQTLNPREATIHSAHVRASSGPQKDVLATVRNYQIGFTYAPFGDPRDVCHFLAWDFPHINDLVMNMDPQVYSFSDLIRLVRVINRDIDKFCENSGAPSISGVCNHWAGNTIYHQHYQFFRIPGIPLLRAGVEADVLGEYEHVQVFKFSWPTPAYLIQSKTKEEDENVMFVADRVARVWGELSRGFDDSFGNGISLKNNTQNTFVTTEDKTLKAIFIPRDRRKLDTSHPNNIIQKLNAGVLEMMGYFIIDKGDDFDLVRRAACAGRKALGDSWLSELAPDPRQVAEFEDRLRICLTGPVIGYEKKIDVLLTKSKEDARREVFGKIYEINNDSNLDKIQRQYLLDFINDSWVKRYGSRPLLKSGQS